MTPSTRRTVPTRRGRAALGTLLLAVALLVGGPVAAQESGAVRSLYKSTHQRLTFDRDVARVAVGDVEVLDFETLSDRELLFLGKGVGRTSVIIWFSDDTIEEFTMLVRRDLSMLERLLEDIHPGIRAEVAPDRDAVVLRGLVPEVSYSIAAENAARSYLAAGSGKAGTAPLIRGTADDPRELEGERTVQVDDEDRSTQSAANANAVINLIQLEVLPASIEEKLRSEIDSVGGVDVTIRRVLRGDVRNDEEDAFILGGTVKDQVALTRVLMMANQIVTGESGNEDNIEVIADEAGALVSEGDTTASSNLQTPTQGGGGGGGAGGAGGGLAGANLLNQVEANIGRAKALDVGNGRILSFITVEDLPQIRVDVRLYEINRTKLFDFNANTIAAVSDFDQPTLEPATGSTIIQGEEAVRVGSFSETDVQNVIGALSGGLANQFQLSGEHFAIDSVFNLLETKGIARSLSRPSLTVLNGEVAVFSSGGEVPISQNFFTDVGGAGANGVLDQTVFRRFGIELGVRPLVGDDNMVTMDVVPSFSIPDPALTASVRATTGSELDTTAFQTRYLRTSARLQDGQSLLIGGLRSITASEDSRYTPWISRIPLIGWLFRTRNTNDDQRDLVIVLHPVIMRDPLPESRIWEYPAASELLDLVRE